MKKKILILSVFTCALSFSQTAYVTGTLPVKVESKTLVYCGKGLEVTSGSAIVTNRGNIQVNGLDFKVTNNATNSNFFNDWQAVGVDAGFDGVSDDLGYGQLIVDDALTTTGNISMDRKMVAAGVIDNVQTGFPFYKDNFAFAFNPTNNPDINPVNSAGRLYHPIYLWNNDLIRFDKMNSTYEINPVGYYIIRKTGGMDNYANGAERIHKGIAGNAKYTVALSNQASIVGPIYNKVNAYNEVYKSYQEDPFVSSVSDAKWGKFQYQFGNPYPSNLDLSYIGFDEKAAGAYHDYNKNGVKDAGEELDDQNALTDIVGVWKIVAGKEVNPVYNHTPNNYTYLKATAVGGKFVAGDAAVLLVKPFEAFGIKTGGTSTQFVFGDGLKTFSYSPKVVVNPAGNGAITFRTAPASFGTDFYQLRMNLLDNTDTYINKTYVVSQSSLTNGIDGALEALDIDSNVGLYTKEEVATGKGLDPNHTDKQFYINQINTSYIGVPIPVFAKNLSDGSKYTINFDLCLGINDLAENQLSYNNTNAKYFFKDNYTNQYFQVYNNSTYTFTKTAGDNLENGNRFQLFFGKLNGDLGIEEIPNNSVDTSIYQNNNDENVIRFSNTWNKANVYVYTAVGQIVYSQKNIDTSNDLILPLTKDNVSVYVVKIENPDTKETINKKVVVK